MKKILVIEDDLTLRTYAYEILNIAGFYVPTASNGKEGIEIAKSDKPDLVICDIMMPEIDGYGCTQNIKYGSKF